MFASCVDASAPPVSDERYLMRLISSASQWLSRSQLSHAWLEEKSALSSLTYSCLCPLNFFLRFFFRDVSHTRPGGFPAPGRKRLTLIIFVSRPHHTPLQPCHRCFYVDVAVVEACDVDLACIEQLKYLGAVASLTSDTVIYIGGRPGFGASSRVKLRSVVKP